MNYRDIKEALRALYEKSYELEEMYVENEGEVTDETEARENEIDAIKTLLCTEGVDSLGMWLASLEAQKARTKDEKAKLAAKEKRIDQTIDFVKVTVGQILRQVGEQKVKGEIYGFSQAESGTTSVNKSLLNETYGKIAEKAIRAAGIPAHVTFTLGASITAVPEGERLPGYFEITRNETARFQKPRATKK